MSCCEFLIGIRLNGDTKELIEAHYGREIDILRLKVGHVCSQLEGETGLCRRYLDRPKMCADYECKSSECQRCTGCGGRQLLVEVSHEDRKP